MLTAEKKIKKCLPAKATLLFIFLRVKGSLSKICRVNFGMEEKRKEERKKDFCSNLKTSSSIQITLQWNEKNCENFLHFLTSSWHSGCKNKDCQLTAGSVMSSLSPACMMVRTRASIPWTWQTMTLLRWLLQVKLDRMPAAQVTTLMSLLESSCTSMWSRLSSWSWENKT